MRRHIFETIKKPHFLLVVVVVEWALCSGGPQIPEQTDWVMKSAYGVGTHDGNSLPPSEPKVFHEEVCSHPPIAYGTWVTLLLCRLEWSCAVFPPGVELDRRRQPWLHEEKKSNINSKVCSEMGVYLRVGTYIAVFGSLWMVAALFPRVVLIRPVTHHVVGLCCKLGGSDCCKGP